MRTRLQQRAKNQGREPTDGEVKFLDESEIKQTAKIVRQYHEAIQIYLKARVRYFKARVLNEIKQQKLTKIQQPEPSSETNKRSPTLIQDREVPQEKREARRNSPRAHQQHTNDLESNSVAYREAGEQRKGTVIQEKANTNTKQMEAPVEGIAKAEPVEKKLIEEMVKQMVLTMDKGLKDYKAKEKKLDSRIAAA